MHYKALRFHNDACYMSRMIKKEVLLDIFGQAYPKVEDLTSELTKSRIQFAFFDASTWTGILYDVHDSKITFRNFSSICAPNLLQTNINFS